MLGGGVLAAILFGAIAFVFTLIGPVGLSQMGGGFGSGRSGGGGFSGGGGGFGGGGASGNW
jgi:uncharacterized protein